MPSRPLNRCSQCQHTWFPRGSDASRKCPACGVVFDEIRDERPRYAPTRPTAGPKLSMGCVGLGLALAVVGVVVATRGPGRNDQAAAPKDKPAPSEARPDVPQPTPDKPRPDRRPGEPGGTPPKAPAAVTPQPQPPAAVEVAPPPRRVGHRLPPSRWSSDWQRVGNVRARVYSVALDRVALVGDRGRVSESAGPVLAVWIEVENLAAVPKRVRWWQDALSDYAELRTDRGVVLGRARFGAGVRVRDMPDQSRDVEPGEPPVAALVVFEQPPGDAGPLTLRLDAARVGESGAFTFTIPGGAWK